MPKKTYVGINNKAKNVPSKGYIGIANKAKKLLKGYIGDANGKARLFWGKKVGNFWFFYETVANEVCITISGRTFFKIQDGIAFYALVRDNATGWVNAFFFSTDEDAVAYGTSAGSNPSSHGSITYNNETWYWMGFGYSFMNPSSFSPAESLIEINNGGTHSSQADDALDILLPCVYSNDFVENYQARQTYNAVFGDREKTLRKAIAIWLYKNYSFKGYGAYDILLENLDTLINELLALIGNDDKIQVYFSNVVMASGSRIVINIDSTANVLNTFRPNSKSQYGGYTYLQNSSYLQTTRYTYAIIESTSVPPIRYFTDVSRGNITTVGAQIINPSQYRVDYGVVLSNLGLNL